MRERKGRWGRSKRHYQQEMREQCQQASRSWRKEGEELAEVKKKRYKQYGQGRKVRRDGMCVRDDERGGGLKIDGVKVEYRARSGRGLCYYKKKMT